MTNGETASIGKAIEDQTGNSKLLRLMTIRKMVADATKAMANRTWPKLLIGGCRLTFGLEIGESWTVIMSDLLLDPLAEQTGRPEDQDQDKDRKGENIAVPRAERREIGQQRRKEGFEQSE